MTLRTQLVGGSGLQPRHGGTSVCIFALDGLGVCSMKGLVRKDWEGDSVTKVLTLSHNLRT